MFIAIKRLSLIICTKYTLIFFPNLLCNYLESSFYLSGREQVEKCNKWLLERPSIDEESKDK